MTKHAAQLFPKGYAYHVGTFKCRFRRDPQTELWEVQITEPDRHEPAFITDAMQNRFDAYALAQAWCASHLENGEHNAKD